MNDNCKLNNLNCKLNNTNYKLYKNKSLKDYCTFKIGGVAKFLFEAYTLSSLTEIVLWCKKSQLKFKVIGLGANLLFDERGYDGAIIVNRTNDIRFVKNFAYVDSGVVVSNLINKCLKKSLGNLENLSGIPSTIGGAIVNNLGAFNTEIGEFVENVTILDIDTQKIKKLNKNQINFSYRDSSFKHKNYIILRAKLRLKSKQQPEIKQQIVNAISKKIETQPMDKFSAGSVFKRCEIIPAKIIDELGFKGFKIGGAQVSTKHAGFIVNTGNATSYDVINLIKTIKSKVLTEYRVELNEEIEYVNF